MVRYSLPLALASLSLLTACGGAAGPAVASSPTPTLEETEPAPDPRADDSLASTCEALEAESVAVWHAVQDEVDGDVEHDDRNTSFGDWNAVVDPLGTCLPAGSGAWLLLARGGTGTRIGDPGRARAAYELIVDLVHVAPDGSRHAAGQTSSVGSDGELEMNTASLVSAGDYDGDGTAEVVLEYAQGGPDSMDTRRAVWTFRQGAVIPYELPDIDIQSLADPDEDGRLDIVSSARFWTHSSCWGQNPSPIGLPSVLFHALGDDTFSSSDEVASDHLRHQCPAAPSALLVADEYDWELDSRRRIACARVWGRSAQAVQAQLRREWPGLAAREDRSCGDGLDDFLAWAAIEPPLTLTD